MLLNLMGEHTLFLPYSNSFLNTQISDVLFSRVHKKADLESPLAFAALSILTSLYSGTVILIL